MPIEFYFTAISPPCRTVWMILEELGLEYTEHDMKLFEGEHKKAEFAEINPRQKVPAIKDGSLIMGESRAIAMYLCNEYGSQKNKKNLYPQDTKIRAKIDQLLYMDTAWWDEIMSYVDVAGVAFRNEKPKIENLDKLKNVLALCNKILDGKKYIAADHLTIADLSVYATLSLIDITKYNEYDEYPNVQAWKKTMSQLPYHKKTCEEPIEKFTAFYQSKLAE